MGIEPTFEAWEVMNFPIPFSSQRHASTSSVGQSLSSNANAFARIELSPENCFRPHRGRCSGNGMAGHPNDLTP
jgi:hypothetical protein